MKRTITFALSFVFITFSFISCGGGKTAQERLDDEKKAIRRFINKNDFKTASFPKDSIFDPNVFYKDDNNFYVRVLDPGTSKKAELGQTILLRFDYYHDILYYMKGDTLEYTLEQTTPFSIKYGVSSYITPMCEGFAEPLSYLGEGALVDLIIPSKLGATYDQSNYRPKFYKGVRYTKFTFTPGI
jgi:hypothetical protein